MNYRERMIDKELAARMRRAGAVLITGAKGCGKTETARRVAKSELRVDVDESIEERMGVDPFLLLEGTKPRLIDEWQLQPKLWDYVRRAVDDSKQKGQFILTGSAQPVSDVRFHSGVGRFSVMRMRPLSLLELGFSSGEVYLSEVLKNQVPVTQTTEMTLDELAVALMRGGWPGNLEKDDYDTMLSLRDDIDLLVESDVSRAIGKRTDPIKVRRLLHSFARNIATEASLTTLTQDTQGEFEQLAANTTAGYIEALESLMVVENLPAFNTHIRSSATLRKASKKHLVDPSLAVAVLGLTPKDLLEDLSYFGLLFESMAVRDLRVYAQALNAKVYHYRDSTGLEVDAIVQQANDTWAAFEIKLGRSFHDEAAASLLKLSKLIDPKKTKPPTSLNIITGFGFAYTRPDGVNVIPLSTLGV